MVRCEFSHLLCSQGSSRFGSKTSGLVIQVACEVNLTLTTQTRVTKMISFSVGIILPISTYCVHDIGRRCMLHVSYPISQISSLVSTSIKKNLSKEERVGEYLGHDPVTYRPVVRVSGKNFRHVAPLRQGSGSWGAEAGAVTFRDVRVCLAWKLLGTRGWDFKQGWSHR